MCVCDWRMWLCLSAYVCLLLNKGNENSGQEGASPKCTWSQSKVIKTEIRAVC